MVDLAKAAQQQGLDVSKLAPSMDPGSILQQLRAVGEVKKVATDTVRGVPTTHFHATVDLNKAVKLQPPARRAQMQRSIDALVQQTGTATIPVEAWVDSENRLRRETATIGKLGSLQLDLFDFGPQQTVTPPPADQTVDLLAVLARQQG
jgi:hypothetical protein